MFSDRDITAFLHTKGFTVVMLLLVCGSCIATWLLGAIDSLAVNSGFGFPSAEMWIGTTPVSAVISVLLTAIAAGLTIHINRIFNVLRSLTALVASMFLVMQMSMPLVLGQLGGGILLVMLMLVCVILLFSVYGDSMGQRRVFMMFALTGLAIFTHMSYALYLPVLLIGCVQMRIFSLRTFLAALLGVITPSWILFGFGIIDPFTLTWPDLKPTWPDFDSAETVQALVTTLFTVMVGVVFTVINIIKILSYNSRVRAYNGFLTILFVFTAIFTLVNFSDFTFYMPLLNCMTAYQVAHFFTYRRQRRSFIPILLIMAAYLVLYLWTLLY